VAAAPLAVKKMEQKRVVNPLFEKRAKNFGIGQVGPQFLMLSFPI
jgi:large subunit ribosomal protein L7Ae